CLQYNNGPFTF
nr:immunoglobulin light chain junction region [Macaca mulatta]MOW14334.1 immunoglobulin light chain junction region [Macaca mulatta]